MISALEVPSVTASRERHADWLELCALQQPKRGVSIREYVRDIGISGTADAVVEEGENDPVALDEDDICEAKAEDAFLEIDERRRACGGSRGAYPFEVFDENVLKIRRGMEKRTYSFMALLSHFGEDARPSHLDGTKLFEELSAEAIGKYLGGLDTSTGLEFDCQVRSEVFGFPRRIMPKGFSEAIDRLCSEMGEGGRHCTRPKLPDQKDGKLDIVAWKEFADREQGKLIAFGQCATGSAWADKITELPQPSDWCRHWMVEPPAVSPIRAFFVPHRVGMKDWLHTVTFGGVLFDRCRIGQLTVDVNRALSIKLAEWSTYALQRLRGK
jgi:hypothetical protein